MSYRLLRNLHLLFGAAAVPFLLMYAVSAVQMAHSKWFNMKPASVNAATPTGIEPGLQDAAAVVTKLNLKGDIRGKLPKVRVVVPGTVHDVSYTVETGAVTVTSTKAGFMGMLNRLHHAAGFWPTYVPMQLWGAAIGLVSLATLGLATTGLVMWWQRKQDRVVGLVLVSANLLFALVVLAAIRRAGP